MASGVASIDSWSDSEIRTKLAELGTPVGPVTETTRKILIKKLKRQLQNSNVGSPAKQRKSLVRYSSGEDSQGEEANMPPPASKAKNLRRKTVGPTELLSTASVNSVNVDLPRSGASERTRGRKSLGSVAQKDPLDTDSDSDISLTYSSSRVRKTRRSEIIQERSPPKAQEPLQDNKSETLISWRNSLKRTTEFVPKPQKSVQEEEEEEEVEDEEEEEQEDDGKEERVPVFQSEFLTRLRATGKLPSSYRSSVSPKPERKSVFSPFSSQSFLSQRGIRSFDDKLYSTKQDTRNSYTSRPADRDGYTSLLSQRQSTSYSSIPSKNTINSLIARYKKWLLGGIAVVAFISALYFLLFVNFNTRIYFAAIDSDQNKYPICGQEGVDPQICIQDEDVKRALDISKVFIPRVLDLTTKAYCDSTSGSDPVEIPTISEEEALKYLGKKMPSVTKPQLEKDLRNFKILVMSNPHWEVEVAGKGLTDVKAILFNGYFVAQSVDLPTACYLRLTIFKLIKLLIVIGILAGVGFLTLFGIRLYKRGQDNHKLEVYGMVNKILNLLSAHHDQNVLPAYLAVDNCRDELIAPSERDKKKRVWDEAVEFLEKHESRVRTEVHSVRGENVRVWRWLPAGGPPMSPSTSKDQFQSSPVLGRLL